VLALDASEWQGRLDRQKFQYAYDMGVRLYIAQLWGSGPTGNGMNYHAEAQLGFAKAVGMSVAGYIWVPPDGTTETQSLVKAGLDAAGKYADELAFVAPDLEGVRLHPTNPVGRLMDVCDNLTLAGKRIVIYCRKNNWPTVMGTGVTEFKQYPLWEARYYLKSGYKPATAPGIDWKWAAFGGWKQRAILQYAGTAPVNGWSADWNVVDESRLGFSLTTTMEPDPAPEPDGEELTVGQYEDLKKAINDAKAAASKGIQAVANGLSGLEKRVGELESEMAAISKARPRNFPNTREYTVKPGDSLTMIAKRELGQSGLFTQIAILNYDRYPSLRENPNHIQPGWKLRLPAAK
jgi:hypothetical protein